MIRKYHNHKLQTTPWSVTHVSTINIDVFQSLLPSLSLSLCCLNPFKHYSALSSFAIILTRNWKLVSLRLITVNVLSLFLTVPRVGLQCVIVLLPGHTHPRRTKGAYHKVIGPSQHFATIVSRFYMLTGANIIYAARSLGTLLHRALLTSFLCKMKQPLTLKALDMWA